MGDSTEGRGSRTALTGGDEGSSHLGGITVYDARNLAASRMDQRWIIHPNRKNQSTEARTNMKAARRRRPWSNCPKPGMKKLHRAAMTLPAEP